MKRIILRCLLLVMFSFSFACAPLVQADSLLTNGAEIKKNMDDVAKAGKYNVSGDKTNPLLGSVATTIVKIFLSVLGVIFLIMILIGGFNWMTAAGDSGKVEKAIGTIQRGVIGLIILVSAYAITAFVFKAIGAVMGPGK